MASISTVIRYNVDTEIVEFDVYIGYKTPMSSDDVYRQLHSVLNATELYDTIGTGSSRAMITVTTSAKPGTTIDYWFGIEWKGKNPGDTTWNLDQSIRSTYPVPNQSGSSDGGSVDPGGSGSGGGGGSVTPGPPYVKPKVQLFSWRSTTDRQTAYNAVTGKGPVSQFKYTVWNAICDKVMELKDAMGVSWDERYLPFDWTKMSANDRTLTADRYNSLSYNIWSGNQMVSKGGTVFGSYFTNLVNSLNNGITNYNNS